MSSVKKKKGKKKKQEINEEGVMAGSYSSLNSSKGSKQKKKAGEKTNYNDEKYKEKIDYFFKLYKNKNDMLNIPEVLSKLDLLEIQGCMLLKNKLEKKKDANLKNKKPPEIDIREFRSLFNFDIFDDMDYNYIFEKIGFQDFDIRYISYNDILAVNEEQSIGLSKEDMVLMFNHTDINNQQIPLKKLKDLIIDWRRKVEDENVDNIMETD